MGPYCKFCDNRCFEHLPMATPPHILKAYGTNAIIATFRGGQRFEKEKIGYCYDDIMAEISKMNKFICATCKTEHIGDIPDSWLTRGESPNETHYCSKVCLDIRLLDDEYKMFEDSKDTSTD